MQKKIFFKLMNPFIKFLIKDCGIEKKNIFIKIIKVNKFLIFYSISFKNVYDKKFSEFAWLDLNLKNADSKFEFYNMEVFNYNILHEISRLRKYHLLTNQKIEIIRDYIFFPDSCENTPFLLLFKNAKYDILYYILSASQRIGILTQNTLQMQNNRGETFLHCLIDNDQLIIEEKIMIIKKIKNDYSVSKVNIIFDVMNRIPLSYYLLRLMESKKIKLNKEFFELLIPDYHYFADYFKSFNKFDYFLFLDVYPLFYKKKLRKREKKKNSEPYIDELKEDFLYFTVYNNKIIESLLKQNEEDALLFALKKCEFLDFNTYLNDLNENLSVKIHAFNYLIQKNWVKSLEILLTRIDFKSTFYEYRNCGLFAYLYKSSETFKGLHESFGLNNDYGASYSYTLFTIIIENLKLLKQSGASYFLKIMSFLVERLKEFFRNFEEKDKFKILMSSNMNIQKRLSSRQSLKKNIIDNYSMLFLEILEIDENLIIDLFEYNLLFIIIFL